MGALDKVLRLSGATDVADDLPAETALEKVLRLSSEGEVKGFDRHLKSGKVVTVKAYTRHPGTGLNYARDGSPFADPVADGMAAKLPAHQIDAYNKAREAGHSGRAALGKALDAKSPEESTSAASDAKEMAARQMMARRRASADRVKAKAAGKEGHKAYQAVLGEQDKPGEFDRTKARAGHQAEREATAKAVLAKRGVPVSDARGDSEDVTGGATKGGPLHKFYGEAAKGQDDYGQAAAKGLSNDDLAHAIKERAKLNASDKHGVSGKADLDVLKKEAAKRVKEGQAKGKKDKGLDALHELILGHLEAATTDELKDIVDPALKAAGKKVPIFGGK